MFSLFLPLLTTVACSQGPTDGVNPGSLPVPPKVEDKSDPDCSHWVHHHPAHMGFEEWTAFFGKTYDNATHTLRKQQTFAQNLAWIQNHNLEHENGGDLTYQVGISEHSDLESREMSRGYNHDEDVFASMETPTLSAEGLPETVNWVKDGAVAPVQNQGSCGSCYAFAAANAITGHYQIATGQLRKLSIQQILDCSGSAGNNGCTGGMPAKAFNYVIANGGIDGEDEYSYLMRNGQCWTAAESRVLATISGMVQVEPNNEEQLQAAVANGPVAVAIDASSMEFSNYRSGVFNGPCGTTIDHAVLVVGYTPEYWVVKNSWGTTWGEGGYIRMARGMGPGGICAMHTAAAYPVVNATTAVPIPSPTPGTQPSGDSPSNQPVPPSGPVSPTQPPVSAVYPAPVPASVQPMSWIPNLWPTQQHSSGHSVSIKLTKRRGNGLSGHWALYVLVGVLVALLGGILAFLCAIKRPQKTSVAARGDDNL